MHNMSAGLFPLYPRQQPWFNCDIHQEISLINPSLWQLLVSGLANESASFRVHLT